MMWGLEKGASLFSEQFYPVLSAGDFQENYISVIFSRTGQIFACLVTQGLFLFLKFGHLDSNRSAWLGSLTTKTGCDCRPSFYEYVPFRGILLQPQVIFHLIIGVAAKNTTRTRTRIWVALFKS